MSSRAYKRFQKINAMKRPKDRQLINASRNEGRSPERKKENGKSERYKNKD